jgi:hypothetical protein
LFVHVTAPALPNSAVSVWLYPHGSTVAKASQAAVSDAVGRANVAFPLSVTQLGTQVDLTAQFSAAAATVSCSPKLHTTTLTPLR